MMIVLQSKEKKGKTPKAQAPTTHPTYLLAALPHGAQGQVEGSLGLSAVRPYPNVGLQRVGGEEAGVVEVHAGGSGQEVLRREGGRERGREGGREEGREGGRERKRVGCP
jgi:hypothetical protein